MRKLYYDHLGKEYPSVEKMCNAWNIPVKTYYYRIKHNWTLKRTLTTPVKNYSHKGDWIDHLGNSFKTQKEMCEYWGIGTNAYQQRIKKGFTTEEALTTPLRKGVASRFHVRDHLDNVYSSLKEMLKFYDVSWFTYNKCIKNGESLEYILTNPEFKKHRTVKDHLGNEFSTVTQMCEYYHISVALYLSRIKLGWSVEDALTKENKNLQTKIGYVTIAKNGMLAEVINVKGVGGLVDARFEDGTVVKNIKFYDFKNGYIKHPTYSSARRRAEQKYKGMTAIASNGQKMECIEAPYAKHLTVRFEDGTIVKDVRADAFMKGHVRNPNRPVIGGSSINELLCSYYMTRFGFEKQAKNSLPEMHGLELDMYNPNVNGHKVAVEYDGFKHTKDKDIKKNKYAKDAGIILFRIREPYLCALNDTSIDYFLKTDAQLSDDLFFTIKQVVDKINEMCGSNYVLNIDKDNDIRQFYEYHNNLYDKDRALRLHEKNMSNDGHMMEIVEYRKSSDIDVMFEDGKIRRHVNYHAYSTGAIKHPDNKRASKEENRAKWLWAETVTKEGERIKIVEYTNADKIKIQFDDGYTMETQLYNFQRQMIHKPTKSLLHKKIKANNGQYMEMIAYRTSRDIDVMFEDKTVVSHIRYDNFIRGKVRNPNFRDYKGTSCCDMNGKKFVSVEAMCRYHNVSRSHYEGHIRRGYSLKDALNPNHKLSVTKKVHCVDKPASVPA